MPPTFLPTLGVKLELLLNGVWTDITVYLLQRNPVQITGFGRPDWTSAMQAAQMTLTLRNDGRFSPKNSGGAYYPNITRNVQIRLSVNSQSVTGVAYNGYRFWGEVSVWPPQSDVSGRDTFVDITAAGIWRRISQQITTLGSAYRRYISNLTGGSVPQAYWPMEDGTGSKTFIPWIPPTAAAGTWTGTPSLAANTSFPGSDGIVQLNAAAITFTVPAGGTATNNVTRILLDVPATGDSASGTTNWNVLEVASAGTVAKFEVYVDFTGHLDVNLRNSGGTIIASGTTATNVKGVPVIVSAELTPSGGNVAWAMRIITLGAAAITESLTGTITTATIGAVSTVKLSRAAALMDTSVGHPVVIYGAVPSLVTAAYAANGYLGEFAMDRFTRLCGELGIATETIGTNTTTATMGPQLDDTPANVLQMIEDTDCGLLYETRDQFGLGYRANASMANQAVAMTLSYTGGVIDPSFAPTYDDSLTRNNITVTNYDGYAQQSILTAGAMSVLAPPSGIGTGYAYQRNVSASADSQIAGIATFLLNVGAVDEVRFPVVTVKLARAQAAALYSVLPSMRVGDYFQITNLPAYLTAAANLRQLAWGMSETLGPREWTISLNSVPETPWETGFSPGTIQTAQIPGGSLVTSQAPGAGGLGGIIQNGSITPAMLNNGITIHTLGGVAVTIAASAPANPNVNDIWIASATGLISQWSGSAWAPQTFNATTVIQAGTIVSSLIAAGTIVASNIAAGTITAALLVAGIVVAGIVNATTIIGATLKIENSFGAVDILLDDATDALYIYKDTGSATQGALVASLAAAITTDPIDSTGVPQGLFAAQITLPNQTTDPPAVSGASVFFSSVRGRPIFLSSSGDRDVIERSTVNVAAFSNGNTTTAGTISATMNYVAGEGNQGSEYELEVDCNVATGGTTAEQLTIQLGVDGALFGPHVTVGSFFLPISSTLAGTIRARITVNTATSANVAIDGTLSRTNNVGGETSFPVQSAGLNASASATFDITLAHTIQLWAQWGGAGGASQQIQGTRTKMTRRN